ncbi:hypothetical protein [Microbacterium sp. NPDC056052]|uniref:hypothetical protein n=1 Tax=Microbacterium sp. NPDC056052 TaxID=3345695 RepID=UPI0035DAF175
MFLTKRSRGALAALAAVPLTIAILSGCSAGGGGQPSSDRAETPSAKSFDDWQLAFAQCMRGEGLDFPDPGKGGLGVTIDQSNAAAFDKASTKCREKLGNPPAAPGDEGKTEEQLQEEALKSAKCFRENGIDMPDPKNGSVAAMPMDVPPEVLKKCLPGAGDADGGSARPNG